ncbi:unnamed protein product [Owenia fusiformis]|uniref:Uncharacterized protein n=1 Tax=Owenia fusiformis TaxID=6347 RepID=A0A8J1Y482_OWEFU|nr:unnamed protein product [Owenia fusiformis]
MMKLVLAFALMAIAHACIRSEEPGPEKPKYEPTDEEIYMEIQKGMKRPMGFDERSWGIMQKKIRAWDYDGWLEKSGMMEKDFFMQKAAIQGGNYPTQFAFMDFADNPYWKNFSYVNPRTQMLEGFLPAITQKACDFCGATCGMRNIGMRSDRCFDEMELTGSGLDNKEFAACAGYGSTPKRANVYNFSAPLSMAPMKQLWIRKTTTDITSEADVNGRKIAIPAPEAQYGQYDAACLQRVWPDVVPGEIVETAADDVGLITQLVNKEADIAMGPVIPMDADAETQEAIKDIQRFGEPFHCVKDGIYQMMHRKDEDMRLFSLCYWYGVVRTGEYKRMCEMYGGMVEEMCIDFEGWMREMMMDPNPPMKDGMGDM